MYQGERDGVVMKKGWIKWNNSDDRRIQAIAGTIFDTEQGAYLPPVGSAK